jgi:hypothetical protein
MQGRHRKKRQNNTYQKCGNVEKDGLPAMETHVRTLVVAREDQKKDRRYKGDVSERGDSIFRETRLSFCFRHMSSLAGLSGMLVGMVQRDAKG